MPVNLPSSQDIRKAREQATKAVADRADIVKTPLLAALGAGEAAASAATDALAKARARATERRAATQAQGEKVQERISALPTELTGLRERLNGEELRKLFDNLGEQVKNAYVDLAARGEQTWSRIRQQPKVAKALKSVEDASGQLSERVDGIIVEARDVTENVLNRVTHDARSSGEKLARTSQRVTGQAAETVAEAGQQAAATLEEAGDEAAHTTRSVSRKAANRTQPRKPAQGNGTKRSGS